MSGSAATRVRAALDALDAAYEMLPCDPELADVEIVGYSTFDTWEFTFEGDEKIRVTELSITGDYTYGGTAK